MSNLIAIYLWKKKFKIKTSLRFSLFRFSASAEADGMMWFWTSSSIIQLHRQCQLRDASIPGLQRRPRFMSWDGVHLTEAAISLLSSKILSTFYSEARIRFWLLLSSLMVVRLMQTVSFLKIQEWKLDEDEGGYRVKTIKIGRWRSVSFTFIWNLKIHVLRKKPLY